MKTNKRKFHWSYAAILREDGTYAIHEVYWDDDKPKSWTLEPRPFTGISIEDLKWGLELALNDIRYGNIFKIKGNKLIKIK